MEAHAYEVSFHSISFTFPLSLKCCLDQNSNRIQQCQFIIPPWSPLTAATPEEDSCLHLHHGFSVVIPHDNGRPQTQQTAGVFISPCYGFPCALSFVSTLAVVDQAGTGDFRVFLYYYYETLGRPHFASDPGEIVGLYVMVYSTMCFVDSQSIKQSGLKGLTSYVGISDRPNQRYLYSDCVVDGQTYVSCG